MSAVKNQYQFIFDLKEFFEKPENKNKLLKDDIMISNFKKRENGGNFTYEDHLKALIYSFLSNQRKWKEIEENLCYIDNEVFYNYDRDKILNADAQFFIDQLTKRQCGNRAIKKQMNNLKDNIEVFDKICAEHGSIDKFISENKISFVVESLSKNGKKYKIKNMGVPLVCEYLRNVGVNLPKPDTHIKRFFGKDRIGKSNNKSASDNEVFDIINSISKETGMSQIEIDRMIWSYCADRYAQICEANPKCSDCVISAYCNNHTS